MSQPVGLSDDFVDMLSALTAEGVEFLMVGAHCLSVHGVTRATGDLDLLIHATPENAARAWRALRRFGAPVEAHGLRESDLTEPEVVYQIGLPPTRIDILTSVDGLSFEEAWDDRCHVTVGALQVATLSRDCLIRNKRAVGRPKDLLDVQLLLAAEEAE